MRLFARSGFFLLAFAACGGGGPSPSPTAPTPMPEVEPMTGRLYVDTNSQAARWVAENQAARPQEAALMRKISEQPMAVWLTNASAPSDARTVLARAGMAAVVFVAYHVPNRDCGGFSAGGAANYGDYRKWLEALMGGIRGSTLVWEPDALGHDCTGSRGVDRVGAAKAAVETAAQNGVRLYLDAGHPDWHPPEEMARRLASAGVAGARGFSLNVSNFIETARAAQYGEQIISILASRYDAPGKHFVIDTSRNGNGPWRGAEAWCNPPERALGDRPQILNQGALDALLWIKRPGESDGECRGGPRAGLFWPEYALGLAERARW